MSPITVPALVTSVRTTVDSSSKSFRTASNTDDDCVYGGRYTDHLVECFQSNVGQTEEITFALADDTHEPHQLDDDISAGVSALLLVVVLLLSSPSLPVLPLFLCLVTLPDSLEENVNFVHHHKCVLLFMY